MNRLRWGNTILFLLFFVLLGNAQYCGVAPSDDLLLRNERAIDQWLNQHRDDFTEREPITITVVFHIVYNTVEENISDEQILSQLAVLNEDFRLLNANQSIVTWPAFQERMVDMELNFKLATKDPDGQPTTGITRRVTTIPGIALKTVDGRRRICYEELGGTDAWCPDHYLNIWVGKFDEGFSAEASFPGQDVAQEDGIRIDPYRVGALGTVVAPYHLGRTLTHEVGHYFNLQHLWGSGSDNSACNDDDGVADTPQQAFTYVNECPGNFNLQSCGSIDQFPNYMNYTDDACMAMFTIGQKERVWAALNALRPGLKQPESCGMVPTDDFVSAQGIEVSLSPNPSGEGVEISLHSNQSFDVQLSIYSSTGQQIDTRDFATSDSFYFERGELPSGIYLAVFNIGGLVLCKQFVFL